jgi:arylformamidase
MLAQTDWVGEYAMPANVLKGVFPISGLFDLRPLRYSWLQPMLQLNTESVRSQSPHFHIAASEVPMLISVGGGEPSELVRQSKDFCSAWQTAGNTARYWEQPGNDHFQAIQGFTEADSPICTEVQKFVQECESK